MTCNLLKFSAATLVLLSIQSSDPINARAGEPIIYPKKGQSEQQQSKDKYSCHEWAKKQLGYDPEMIMSQEQQAGEAAPKGGAVRGAAKGAGAGAIGGAIGGDTGKGAAIGAGVGAVGGAGRKARSNMEQNQIKEQAQQKIDEFNKAEGTCLSGKGYSVS